MGEYTDWFKQDYGTITTSRTLTDPDDRIVIREWLSRLRDTGDPVEGMNELTAARLAGALKTTHGRDMIVASLLDSTLDADALARVMNDDEPIPEGYGFYDGLRGSDMMRLTSARNTDRHRLENADRVCSALAGIDPSCRAEALGVMLLIAWLAGATDRARAILGKAPASVFTAVIGGALMMESREAAAV
ncbi:hypothetical protein [Bifidobacterium sp. SO1]|uniref:hypothetical protein n=1 Tax=Bifidobacterium sp. SO1 TaxID=2809029 RepID=UPI001BDD8A09|nr:hypothetical protein [Bifidobacterium sp. SO1]MBT1161783.1 hypothetical protein [Bifidobacterium sp. SO1]